MDDASAAEALDRIVESFQGKERFLVQTHNNPDPDSIASALAVRHLVRRYTGREAVIAFGGIVGRSENRALVSQLEIPLTPGSLIDYDAYDFTAVCDTQPGTNFTSFPKGFVPTVVIDHHPCREDTLDSDVVIVEPGYGATSSLMAQMLLAKGIPIPTDVATALYYGIKSETQDLCRETTDVDARVYRKLAEIADRKVVSRIETERVPRAYYGEIVRTIHSARIYGDAVAAPVGAVRVPDMVAEMADFLMRLEAIRWVCVMGEYEDTLYLSMRTTDEEADAGTVIREVVAELGSAGGHLTMAGGQVPLVDLTDEQREERRELIVSRFVPAVGGDLDARKPLVEPGTEWSIE